MANRPCNVVKVRPKIGSIPWAFKPVHVFPIETWDRRVGIHVLKAETPQEVVAKSERRPLWNNVEYRIDWEAGSILPVHAADRPFPADDHRRSRDERLSMVPADPAGTINRILAGRPTCGSHGLAVSEIKKVLDALQRPALRVPFPIQPVREHRPKLWCQVGRATFH